MVRKYKRNIDWHVTQELLNQVYRSGLEYAFVSRNFKQVCPFVYCKDFLHDALQGHLNGIRRKIHGFLYDPNKHKPICTDRLRLIIACSRDRHFGTRIPNMLDFIHKIEDKLDIKKKTIIRECANPPEKYKSGGIWLLESHKRWMIAPPMLSMYTLLLRLGLVHYVADSQEATMLKIETGVTKPYGSKDKSQMKAARIGMARILQLGDQRIFSNDIKKNYSISIPLNYMHDHMGIVGFSKRYTSRHCPQWHKES